MKREDKQASLLTYAFSIIFLRFFWESQIESDAQYSLVVDSDLPFTYSLGTTEDGPGSKNLR